MISAKENLLIIPLLLILAIFSAGCLDTSFGAVEYSYPLLNVEINNAGDEADAYIQVTVFDLSGFRQIETGNMLRMYI